MPRMFCEAGIPKRGDVREAAQLLMAELDVKAAQERHRVVGDVAISEYDSPFLGRVLHIEADVVPI